MIPTSFQLLGHAWTVEHVHGDVIAKDGDRCKGLCEFDELTIRVNVDLAPSLVWHTFMHEVMHAVLYSMGHELTSNEGFVDSIGGCLAQVLTSAVRTTPSRPRAAPSVRPKPSRFGDSTRRSAQRPQRASPRSRVVAKSS